MKKIFCLLLWLVCAGSASAQDLTANAVFLPLGEEISISESASIFLKRADESLNGLGAPVVLNQQTPAVPQVQITNFLGQVQNVPFVTHIPLMSIFIQIMSDKSVVVSERFSLVLSNEVANFQLSMPQGAKTLSLAVNHQSVPAFYEHSERSERIMLADPLEAGVHQIELSYMLKDGVFIDKKKAFVALPIVDKENDFWVTSLNVLTAYPAGSRVPNVQMVFGQEEIPADEVGNFYQSEKGQIMYVLNGLMPPKVAMKYRLNFNANVFDETQKDTLVDFIFSDYAWFWLSLMTALVIWLYYYVTAKSIEDEWFKSVYQSKMRQRVRFDFGQIRYLLKNKIDGVTALIYALVLFKKGAIDITVSNEHIYLQKTQKPLSWPDKKMLHLLIPPFKHKVSVQDLKVGHAMKSFVMRGISSTMALFMLREQIIALALLIIMAVVLLFVGTSITFILWALLIVMLAWYLAQKQFIRIAQYKARLRTFFEEYTNRSMSGSVEICAALALDKELGENHTLHLAKKNISYTEFKQLFLSQIKQKKGE